MGLNIDLEKARQSLLKQRGEIEEKLKALDIVENMAIIQNNHNTEDGVGVDNKNEFSKDITLINAAKSIFVNNPDKEFFVSDIEKRLRKGGVKGKYKHTTVSSTLKRLVERGDLQKRKVGTKNKFKLNKKL